MTNRQRELYLKLRGRAGRLRRSLASRRRTPKRRPAWFRKAGHPPDVALERTNLGPVMDEAVLRAKQQMRVGVDPDYDLVYANFDVLHYLLQAPHLLDEPDVDLVEHFFEYGASQRLSPDPNFSAVEYAGRYPFKAAAAGELGPYLPWLRQGRAAGDIGDPVPGLFRMAHVLGLEAQEVAELVAERRTDLQERFRTGKLGQMLARAAEIEPLIGATWTEVAKPKLLPFSTSVVAGEVFAIYRAQELARFKPARLVFVINRARWGGGRRMEGHLAHALAANIDPDEIVVIYTDDSAEAPVDRYPEGVREIDFHKLTRDLPKAQAQHGLVMLLRTFNADAIVNVNSKLLYHAMRTYGKALAVTERIFLCFFCNEQTAMGTWDGWSLRYFYRTFDYAAGVITDSDYLARKLRSDFRVGEKAQERMHVLRAPVDASLPVVSESPARPDRRPQVFWAGRWDRQKRIPLFLEVARLLPDVDFRMWGEPVMRGATESAPPNVSVEGRYAHISEVPLSDADVWLYTSAWDGAPSQLLEVAMTGVPIVGTLVGGTGEVLSEQDAWAVGEDEGAEAYVAAIRDVLADPAESRRRALALRERMLRERTEKEFAKQATDLLLAENQSQEAGR